MSKNLHIVPKMPLGKDQKYDAGMSCLTLAKAGAFTVDITKRDGLHDGAPQKLPPFKRLTQEEVWKMPDLDDRKMYVADHKKRDEKEAQYNKERDAFNEKLHEELATLSWCWETVGNGMEGKTMSANDDFVKGLPKEGEKQINFPEILVGGGLAWLEVFTKNDPATGKVPNGLFVRATGLPEIVRVAWTDLDCKPIKEKVKFGSKVLLNIYTNNLYGQDLEIGLWDKDTADPDDLLPISNKGNFTGEALIFKTLPNEVNKVGVSGGIQVNGKAESHVQKVKIPVLVDLKWMFSAGKELKIYPTVKSKETGEFLKVPKDSFLEVGLDGVMHETVIEATNNPLLTGKVETNVASFRPCRYDKVELKKQNAARSTILFDSSNNEQRAKKSIAIEIVAGKKETYLLDFDVKTLECERKPKHTTKEITILTIPKDYELKIDPSSKAEHKIKKEEKELVKTESSSSSSVSYMGGLTTSQKEVASKENGLVIVRQKQIEFDAFYNYDIPMNSVTTFPKALKYFWLPSLSEDKIRKITAHASSCAFQQNINIAIYPDIKWSLIFGFNVEEDQLTALIPSWDKEKIVKKFEWKAEKFSEKFGAGIDKKTKDKINKQALDVYKDVHGTPKAEPHKKNKETNKKGKLDTLLDIMKNVDVSLKAQIYEETELELTRDFFENAFNSKIYKDIYEKLRWAVDMMDGKLDNPKNKTEGDKAINDFLSNNELSNRAKHLKEALTRPAQEVEILFPKVSLGGDWQYDKIDATKYPMLAGRSGLAYNVALIAKPLIGMEIKWHILDLLCRKHPIAYAVLAAVKTLLAALGDNPDGIKVDFWVKGEINADLKFAGNYLSKDNQITTKGETHITAGIELSIMLVGKVVKGKYEAIAEVGVGGKGEVGLGLEGSLGVDDQGVWLQTSLIFDGIKLSFEAVISARIIKEKVNKDGTVEQIEIVSSESKIEGEVTLLDHTFTSEKFYLNT